MYYLKEKKSNAKSVRMSDKVLEYVEGFAGNGFNEKFENMVLYFMENEPKLKERISSGEKRLKSLEYDISKKQGLLKELTLFENRVGLIKTYLSDLFKDLEDV